MTTLEAARHAVADAIRRDGARMRILTDSGTYRADGVAECLVIAVGPGGNARENGYGGDSGECFVRRFTHSDISPGLEYRVGQTSGEHTTFGPFIARSGEGGSGAGGEAGVILVVESVVDSEKEW